MRSPSTGEAEVQRLVSSVAKRMSEGRQTFIEDLIEVTRHEVHALDHDTRLRGLLEASITENIVAAVNFLDNGTAVDDLGAPTAALTYARTLAQRDIPLSALIRAYRIGHSRFVDTALELMGADPATAHMDVVLRFVRRSADYIDKVCEEVGRSYEAERDRWVSSRSGLRSQVVNQLVSGATTDVRQAEATLGYRLAGLHVGMLVWPDDAVAAFDVVKLFDDVSRTLGKELRTQGSPLVVPNDEREVRMWFSVRDRAHPDSVQLAAAISAAGLAACVAIGEVSDGIDGFRRSMRQAAQVKDIMLSTNNTPTVVSYTDIAPIALMSASAADLRLFVVRVLGPLAVDDERSATLRETLRVFLDLNRSYAAAGQSMMLHRNTIQYRVQQALQACDRDLDVPGGAFEVQLALSATRWLGPAVLTKH